MPVNRRDLDFYLYEMLQAESLCEHRRYAKHSRKTFDAMLDTAQRVAEEKRANHNAKADANKPHIKDGRTECMSFHLPQGVTENPASVGTAFCSLDDTLLEVSSQAL